MRYRIGLAGLVLVAAALALRAEENLFRIELVPTGTMVSLDQPVLTGGVYVFRAWPDGAQTSLRLQFVRRITQLTGPTRETIYQIELIPSGTFTARDQPALKGNTYVFHTWRDGTFMSVRQSDVRKITPMTGDQAFWAEQRLMGEKAIGNLAMQGTSNIVEINTPQTTGSSQAGPTNLSAVADSGISGAPAYGNWQYEGTPGVSDAYAPANATVRSPGGVPRMPAATDGREPPR